MATQEKIQVNAKESDPAPKNNSLILWVWLVVLVLAGILMAYKIICS